MSHIHLTLIRAGLLLCWVLQLSCTPITIPIEELKIKIPDDSGDIDVVVHGAIFSLKSRQLVKLSRPGDWPDGGSNLPISGAEVFVNDGATTFHFEEDEALPGHYFSIDSIEGLVNRTYNLSVIYEDKTYSASDKMTSVDLTGFSLPIRDVRQTNGLYTIDLYKHNFGYNNPIRLAYMGSLDENSNYSYAQMNCLQLLSAGSEYIMIHKGNPVNGVFSGEKYINPLYGEEEDVAYVYFMSLSPEYYEFLLDFYNETDWSVGLFAVQPGNLRTNVSEGGSGYFFAADIEVVDIKIEDLVK